jgi:hypothetical protein
MVTAAKEGLGQPERVVNRELLVTEFRPPSLKGKAFGPDRKGYQSGEQGSQTSGVSG